MSKENRRKPADHLGRPRACRNRPGAFTLIELLVVIAIIGILAGLLLPVLARTKLKATQAACMANQKQLSLAFVMYADDNGDRIVPFSGGGGFWSDASVNIAPGMSPDTAMNIIQNALSRANPLFRYDANVAAYHCPGDTRFKLKVGAAGASADPKYRGWAYDSYSKTQNLAGDPTSSFNGMGEVYVKMSQIYSPSLTLAFIEDADNRGYNQGTFELQWITGASSGTFNWNDAPAMFHGNVDTMSFADGHAESHKWTEAAVVNAGAAAGRGDPNYKMGSIPNANPKSADHEFIRFRMRFPKWVE